MSYRDPLKLFPCEAWKDHNSIRAYFRKIKRPGIESFLEKCPFWKKSFSQFESKVSTTNSDKGVFNLHFLINQVLFCQTKFPLYWAEEPFSRIISLNSLILNTFLNFSWIFLKCFYHIFYMSDLQHTRDNGVYAVKNECCSKRQKIK